MPENYQLQKAIWELTLKCNFRCIHCGSNAGKPRKEELTTQEALKVCHDLYKLGCKEVTLMGGELFLREDWFEIAKKLASLGIKVSLISNGFLINSAIVSKLKKLSPKAIGLSLDGGTQKTHDCMRGVKGSFKKVVHSLKLLKKAGLPVTIITTLTKLNINELDKIRDIVIDEGICWQIQIASCNGTRFSRKLLIDEKEFYKAARFIAATQKKYKFVCGADDFGYHSYKLSQINTAPYSSWNGCHAGIKALGIQSNGNVKDCLSLPDSFIEGNVKKQNLVEIWNNKNKFSLNRRFKKEQLWGYCRK